MPYHSSEAAEAAFYEAFENADLTLMSGIWAREATSVCIHPMGTRLQGMTEIMESWREIFSSGPKMLIELTDVHIQQIGDIAIHSLCENMMIKGSKKSPTPILASNVYQRVDGLWYMLMHHASLSPDAMRKQQRETEATAKRVVH